MEFVVRKTDFYHKDSMVSCLPKNFAVELKENGKILSLWQKVSGTYDHYDEFVPLCEDVFLMFDPSGNDVRVMRFDKNTRIGDAFGLDHVDIKPVSEISVEKIRIEY